MHTLSRWLPAVLSLSLTVACLGKDADDDDDDDGGSAPEPYGPENTWPHADVDDVPSDLEGTGWGVGDIAYNWTLLDQYGQEVELYQFYGQVIVIDNFTEW
ncbi:hypothetical protein L6R53_13910 [Myxococcota bacterium]|nr:hypothetical protein [Myxococcota bacterium]